MENKEIMVNEDVIEAAEEFVEIDSGDNFGKSLAIGGAVVLGACLAYKYAIKPLAGKIKEAIEKKKNEAEDVDYVEEPDEE